jgi:hypothetical protein
MHLQKMPDTRSIPEISMYAEEGAKIMINQGRLEEPPQADGRDHLINGRFLKSSYSHRLLMCRLNIGPKVQTFRQPLGGFLFYLPCFSSILFRHCKPSII